MKIEGRKATVDGVEMFYPTAIPKVLPSGKVVVHNNITQGITPHRRQGVEGFRFWLQDASGFLEPCGCGWAPRLAEHYRMRRSGSHSEH